MTYALKGEKTKGSQEKVIKNLRIFQHGDIILSRCNNFVFLLQKSIEIGKSLISSATQEFESFDTWLLAQTVKLNTLKYLLGCKP